MLAMFALSGIMSSVGLKALDGSIMDQPLHAHTIELIPSPVIPVDLPVGTVATAKGTRGMVVNRAGDGLFYVTAKVNGRRVRFVVDTGSTHVVIGRRDALALGIAAAPASRQRVRTAHGDSAMAWVKLPGIQIGTRQLASMRAIVIADGPDVSLMGQEMLSQLGPVRIDGNRLTLG